jgi:hypothetical protein
MEQSLSAKFNKTRALPHHTGATTYLCFAKPSHRFHQAGRFGIRVFGSVQISTARLEDAGRDFDVASRKVFDASLEATQYDNRWRRLKLCELSNVAGSPHTRVEILVLLELSLAVKLLL